MVTWEGKNAGADVDARLSDSRLSTSAQLSPEPPHTPHSSTSYPACTASMSMVAKASCTLCFWNASGGSHFLWMVWCHSWSMLCSPGQHKYSENL